VASEPDEIRDQIEATRQELASDVDRLADRTVPSRVVHRRWEGVKDNVRDVKEKVMGTGDSVQDVAGRAGDRVEGAAQTVADSVRRAPDAVKRQARGNPLAVGVIAFGVGLLVATLIPETEAERQAGAKLAEHRDEVLDKVKETGQELREGLGDSVREAASQVKETAVQAASSTAEQAKESGRATVEETRSAASTA
jgi:gas vesicle protein